MKKINKLIKEKVCRNIKVCKNINEKLKIELKIKRIYSQHYRFILLAFLLLFLTGTVVGTGGVVDAVGGRGVISIPEEVEVPGPEIKLGEIASISGIDGELYSKIRTASLGGAGLPGYSKGLSRQYIIRMMAGLGINTAEYELKIPPRVEVRTACRILKGEVLLAFARNYLERELGYPRERLKIVPRTYPEEVILPDQDYELTVSPSSGGDLLDNPYLVFQIWVADEVYRRVFLGFTVEVQEEVYTAARRIERGERLERQDFKLETRTINKLQGKPLKDFNLPLIRDGLTRLAIPEGAVLTDYYLGIPSQQVQLPERPETERQPGETRERPVQLIRYGDELEAEVVVGNVTVATTVKACQAGARGEYITVENPGSGRRFRARVIAANLVRVEQ